MKRCVLFALVLVWGCTSKPPSGDKATTITPIPAGTPKLSLAWSEYPSWSVYGVAAENGLIDGREGFMGPIERKWGVDIVLKEADYDTCINLYASSTVDAACLTTLDALAPSLGRNSVVVAPTSTSVGADACISATIPDVDALEGKPTFGLEKSVSQFAFERNLILKGKDPKKFPFKNMDPAAAAQAIQTGQKNVESIMVWNPFVLQTLRTRDGAKVLFDSSTIPEEIIDSLVIGKDSLAKPGGEAFACAIIDAYYEVCKLMADPKKGDETYVALGRKFSNLGLQDMKLCCTQTRFYSTPDKGLALFNSDKFRKETTPGVVDFCVSHGICATKPTVGFDQSDAQLNIVDKFIKQVQAKQ